MRRLPLTRLAGCAAACALVGALAHAASSSAQAADGARTLTRRARLVSELAPAELVAGELDGRPGHELVLVDRAGELTAYALGPEGLVARGTARLAHPTHALLDVARIGAAEVPGVAGAGGAGERLLVLSPDGLEAFGLAADGFAEPLRLAPRARFGLRTGRPQRSPFARDVDRDGLIDVVVPSQTRLEVWLNEPATADGAASAPAGFRKAATIASEARVQAATDAGDLSDTLLATVSIPGLATADVDGDGLPDLLVEEGARRAFHLQRDDGSFPGEPDVALDLALFRDTTPRPELELGRTLTLGDDAHFTSHDLDGDDIPDYVIAHRRKVWVFHGGADGPQFELPSTVLKTADDVTALLVAQLDGDGLPDLLLIKLELPGVGTLIRGLFAEWGVRIDAFGYRNDGARRFETKPAWRGGVDLVLPSILSVIEDPEALIERFRALEREIEPETRGDLDGDGRADLVTCDRSAQRIGVWLAREGEGLESSFDGDDLLRRILFEDSDRSWDVERLVAFLTGLARGARDERTSGRAPDVRLEREVGAGTRLARLLAVDLDGDGRAEVVLDERSAGGAGAVEVLGLGPPAGR